MAEEQLDWHNQTSNISIHLGSNPVGKTGFYGTIVRCYMSPIHLLQLGDLHLTETNWRNNADSLEHELRTRRLWTNLDAVVVCGNLTRDGAPASFEAAEKFLHHLESGLLSPTASSPRKILVVPGCSDIDPGTDGQFENFRRFYNAFFAHETFDPRRPIVRRLRDLTLIGATYLNHDDPVGANDTFSGLQNQLEREESNWRCLDYLLQGPIVLANSESPLLSQSLRARPWERKIRAFFHEIDLYLFGSGPVAFLPSEPFCFAPVSVGLGPAGPAMRANILEFRRPTVPRPALGQPTHLRFDLAITALSIEPAGTQTWSFHYHAPKSPQASDSEDRFLTRTFLEKLDDNLQGNHFIAMLGVGNRWRQVIANGLRNKTRIGSRQVLIESLPPLRTYPVRRPRDWQPKDFALYRDLEQFRTAPPPYRHAGDSGLLRIALIIDEAFLHTEYNLKETYESMQRVLSSLCTPDFRILYLVSAYGMPWGAEPPPTHASRMDLEPLDPESLLRLLELISFQVPVDRTLMERISGGYVSFLSVLFDTIKNDFERWDSAHEITRESALSLVRRALHSSRELRRETTDFFDFMRNQPKGLTIARFILDRLSVVEEQHRLTVPIRFTPGDLRFAGLKEGDIEWTMDPGIIGYDGVNYELKERIPFLVQLTQPAPPPRIFISYAEPDGSLARKLIAKLESLGMRSWEYRMAADLKRTLPDQIWEQLESSDSVVVIWTSESIKSRFVIREARHAAKPQRPKLINWYTNVKPQSVRDTMEKQLSSKEKKDNVLDAFRDFVGFFSLEDVALKLADEFRPFDRRENTELAHVSQE